MANRKPQEELQKAYADGAKVYSISRCNTIDQCLYQAYNSYILKRPGLKNIYGILGGRIHETLEYIVNGDAYPNELQQAMQDELNDLEMLSIAFPKDMRGNDTIRNNWIADMTHFCTHFKPPKGKLVTEEFFLYKLKDGRYVQGYIDLIRVNKDGTVSIYDWKTSSKFNKADLLHHGRQLVLYAIAMEELGYKVRDIAWIMLKYVKIEYMGKKRSNSKEETLITKVVNRGKIVQELRDNIESDLRNLGWEELDIEFAIVNALEKNSLDDLPKEIIDKYKISPYIENYSLTDELKQECLDYINAQADLFESLDPKNPDEFTPRKFTKINSKGKEVDDVFFCNSLCAYRMECKYLKEYKEKKEAETKENSSWEDDLF